MHGRTAIWQGGGCMLEGHVLQKLLPWCNLLLPTLAMVVCLDVCS